MKTAPYSLATDGSTDYGDCKLYPLVVKYFDPGLGRVLTVLLSMPECHVASTGQNIFKLMDSELEKRDITWDNCMSFGADNAMVMQGHGRVHQQEEQCSICAGMPVPSDSSCCRKSCCSAASVH